MKGHKKRFSIGWMTGIAAGLGTSAALVYAVTIPNTFSDGQTASAAAVNANFQALKNAIDGCSEDMVRVGASCVDKFPAALFSSTGEAVTDSNFPADCQATGAGCTVVAQSRSDAGGAIQSGSNLSWGRAATACANAGKRLATASEIITASNTGAITVGTTSDDYTFVDAAAARPNPSDPYAGTFVQLAGGTFQLLGVNTPYTEGFAAPTNVSFRCAK